MTETTTRLSAENPDEWLLEQIRDNIGLMDMDGIIDDLDGLFEDMGNLDEAERATPLPCFPAGRLVNKPPDPQCRWCGGTGRVKLLTSEQDCDCVIVRLLTLREKPVPPA